MPKPVDSPTVVVVVWAVLNALLPLYEKLRLATTPPPILGGVLVIDNDVPQLLVVSVPEVTLLLDWLLHIADVTRLALSVKNMVGFIDVSKSKVALPVPVSVVSSFCNRSKFTGRRKRCPVRGLADTTRGWRRSRSPPNNWKPQ